MIGKNILSNFNKIKIERKNNIHISNVKSLPNKTIHTNPIYLCKLKESGKEIVIKFFRNSDVMKKEGFCNGYLKNKGLSVP